MTDIGPVRKIIRVEPLHDPFAPAPAGPEPDVAPTPAPAPDREPVPA